MLRFKKQELFYIPNLLTYLRFLLVPAFVILYFNGYNEWAVGALLMSIISDFLDGKAARALNQVSELGILLDPVADKVTQGVVVICLGITYPMLWYLFAIEFVKEAFMAIAGAVTIKKKHIKFGGAKWYGKVGTGITDGTLLLLLLFPGMPDNYRLTLVVFCGTWMLVTLMLYAHNYWGMWHGRTAGTLTVEPKGGKPDPVPFEPDPDDPTLHDYHWNQDQQSASSN